MQFITLKLFTKPFYAVGGNTNWCTIPGSKSGKICSKLKNIHTGNIGNSTYKIYPKDEITTILQT